MKTTITYKKQKYYATHRFINSHCSFKLSEISRINANKSMKRLKRIPLKLAMFAIKEIDKAIAKDKKFGSVQNVLSYNIVVD